MIEVLAIAYFYSINRTKDKAFKQSATKQEEQDGEMTPTEDRQRPLQHHLNINTKTEQGRQEQHLRYLDIAENREKSIYFRYSL